MGALVSYFLLPLLSGFVLILAVPHLKYRSLRDNGYRLLLKAVLFGIILLIAGDNIVRFSKYLVDVLPGSYHSFATRFDTDSVESKIYLLIGWGANIARGLFEYIWEIFSEPFSHLSAISNNRVSIDDGAVMALILSGLVAAISGLWERRNPASRVKYAAKAIKEQGQPFELLFDAAFHSGRLVAVTLKSRKVYIGSVILPLHPTDQEKSIRLFPYKSGYRDQATLGFVETNDYAIVWTLVDRFDQLEEGLPVAISNGNQAVKVDYDEVAYLANDFNVTIAWSEIETAMFWSDELHAAITNGLAGGEAGSGWRFKKEE